MSDKHHDMSSNQNSAAQPNLVLRTIVITCALLLVLTVVLIKFAAPGSTPAVDEQAEIFAKAQRLQKVGSVAIQISHEQTLRTGQEVYQTVCFACHATGISGAPKFGDHAQSAPRLTQGFDTLLHAALQGKGAMPPQAGSGFSDFEIARAVVYMANEAGASFPEPTPPVDAQ